MCAQRISTSWLNTAVPGSYSNVKVNSIPASLGVVGNVAIIGEAAAGPKFSEEDALKSNYYAPTQYSDILAKYGSGAIVDAFKALSSPSGDINISGAPSRIYVLKTNSGTKASSALGSYGSLKAKLSGLGGNSFFYKIDEAQAEVAPSITGAALDFSDPSIFTGKKFAIRLNGGLEILVDVLTGLPTTYDTIAEMAALIQAALPAGISCSASGQALKFQVAAELDPNANGFGKTFELVEKHAGDLAVLGLIANVYKSAAEAQVAVNIQNPNTNLNEDYVCGGDFALEIGYQGSSAALVISDSLLTITVVGGSGSSLSIDLTKYVTIGSLVDYINAQEGYIASVSSTSKNYSPSIIDNVSVECASSAAGVYPCRIKKDAYIFARALSSSLAVDFIAVSEKGLPSVKVKTYLAGGLVGSTANQAFADALTALEAIDVNFVVPLVSRDAALDIVEGLTDLSSSYTVDSVNAMVRSHCLKVSTPLISKFRLGCLSKYDTFENVKEAAGSLSHPRITLCFQPIRQVNSLGATATFMPWMASCIAAGMQAAGFYKGIVHKFANIVDFKDVSGFDSGNVGQIEAALESGLLFLEATPSGSRWVSDQTTYGFDSNFVYNSLQAMFLADVLRKDLSVSLDQAFVGQSLADVDASAGLSFLASKMLSYKQLKMIAASDDAAAGYKNAQVRIVGPSMYVSVEVKLSTSLYFVALEIAVSQITTTATA